PCALYTFPTRRSSDLQTQQGVIEGVAAFVSHQGTTFMLVGYSPQGGLAANSGTFMESMNSFGDLTDPSAQNVKPATLKIVRIDRSEEHTSELQSRSDL